MSVFRVAFRAPAFVHNGRMRACWCGLRTEGGQEVERGLYEMRGAADARNTHAVHETAGVKSSRQAGLVFGVVVTKRRDRKWRGGLYETRGAADAQNTHAVCETAGVESSAAVGLVFGVVTWHGGCRLWLFEGGDVGIVDGNGTAAVVGDDVAVFVRLAA